MVDKRIIDAGFDPDFPNSRIYIALFVKEIDTRAKQLFSCILFSHFSQSLSKSCAASQPCRFKELHGKILYPIKITSFSSRNTVYQKNPLKQT